MGLIARAQSDTLAAGGRPDNRVALASLDPAARDALAEGLRRTRILPDLVRDLLVQ